MKLKIQERQNDRARGYSLDEAAAFEDILEALCQYGDKPSLAIRELRKHKYQTNIALLPNHGPQNYGELLELLSSPGWKAWFRDLQTIAMSAHHGAAIVNARPDASRALVRAHLERMDGTVTGLNNVSPISSPTPETLDIELTHLGVHSNAPLFDGSEDDHR